MINLDVQCRCADLAVHICMKVRVMLSCFSRLALSLLTLRLSWLDIVLLLRCCGCQILNIYVWRTGC